MVSEFTWIIHRNGGGELILMGGTLLSDGSAVALADVKERLKAEGESGDLYQAIVKAMREFAGETTGGLPCAGGAR